MDKKPNTTTFWVVLRPLIPVVFPIVAGLMACGSDRDSQGAGPSAGVVFHADVSALPGVNKDTGLQPSGSPVQLQLMVSASGNGAIDASAKASGSPGAPVLTAIPGSGKVSVDGSFALEGRLVASITGLPSYDGPIPGLDNVKIAFQAAEPFDPWLLAGSATAKAPIPETDLPSIPLPGGLPGSLILKVGAGSTVDLEFRGACASIQGDQAQYTGQVTRSGSLVLVPRIEIDVPVVGKKTFEIPEVTVPIALPAEDVDLGTRIVGFGPAPSGGETAMVGSCHGADAGIGGAGGAAGGGQGGTGGSAGGTGGSAANAGAGGESCEGSACMSETDCCSSAPECIEYVCSVSLCKTCTDGACGMLMDACRNNSECLALWTCSSECSGTSGQIAACEDQCFLAHASAQEAYTRMYGCFYAKCHDACELGSCLLKTGNTDCDACITASCGAQCDAASDSQECMTWHVCGSFCREIDCTVDCDGFSVAGCMPLNDCLVASCSTACGG